MNGKFTKRIIICAIILYLALCIVLQQFVFHNSWTDWVSIIAFLTGLIAMILIMVKRQIISDTIGDIIMRFLVGLFLFIGISLIVMAYNLTLWKNPPWDPSVFGAGISIVALSIALFAIFWPKAADKPVSGISNNSLSQQRSDGTDGNAKLQMATEPSDLCVPIYLNQQIVFDLLAILQDGFSQFSVIKTSSAEAETKKSNVGASIGESNIFAFLGVSLKAGEDDLAGKHKLMEISKEKVHTPTSLFATLRFVLKNNKLIKYVKSEMDLASLATGQFVEFKAVLRKNPLVDTMEGFKSLMELIAMFVDDKNGLGKGNSVNFAEVTKQIDAMLTALKQSDSIEIVGEMSNNPKMKAVLSTRLSYFNDRDASEIIDGEFSVLGKVIRIIRANSGENINLLRKTTLGRLNRKLFDQLKDGFKGVEGAGVTIPDLITEIGGPVIQIVPIAIFT